MNFLSTHDLEIRTEKWSRHLGIDDATTLGLPAPVLLVLDMQNEFLQADGQLPVWGGPAIIPNVVRLINLFRELALPVIFTRHICLEPFKHQAEIGIMQSVPDAASLLRDGSMGAALHESIVPRKDEMVITKFRYSAFYDTSLDTVLRVNSAKQVIITGVATNICCETTAHDAFFRGYEVCVTADGTGGTDESAHLASLKNIVLSYGKVATVDQVGRSLGRRKAA